MTKRLNLLAVALVLLASACTSSPGKEYKPVGPDGKEYTDTTTQVNAVQTQIRQAGEEVISLLGGTRPNPGTVRIGPVPCSGKVKDFADDGVYFIGGGWQVNLAPDKQVATLTAIRDAWQAKGFTIKQFREFSPDRVSVAAEDPKTGFFYSIDSTEPPSAVSIGVNSPCIRPPDGIFPSTATVYE